MISNEKIEAYLAQREKLKKHDHGSTALYLERNKLSELERSYCPEFAAELILLRADLNELNGLVHTLREDSKKMALEQLSVDAELHDFIQRNLVLAEEVSILREIVDDVAPNDPRLKVEDIE